MATEKPRREVVAAFLVRLEIALVGLFFASWLLAALSALELVSLAGLLDLSLYPYYSLAAVLGWVAGNVYVVRRRSVAPALRLRVLWIYLLAPPGVLYLLRALAPARVQALAPLVPLYAFGVFAVLFLVPVVFRPPKLKPPKIGR